jgi:ATP-dependent Lhr-like helicase
LEGEFRPGGTHREWCEPEVMQQIRRKSLARLRREIEPVEQSTFARFTARWQGVTVRRRGLAALLDTVENLQGAPLLASELEREILPVRIAGYRPEDFDAVIASGQVMWVGLEQIGNRDGRIALYLNESVALLLPPQELRDAPALSERAEKIKSLLAQNGASFIATIHAAIGGFPGDTRDALWELVWSGQITNDTFHPLRELRRASEAKREKAGNLPGAPPGSPEFLRRLRSRNGAVAQGRWSLIRQHLAEPINITQWSANVAQQLLVRHGIVLRETAIAENIPRGYPTIYPALKTMEDGGWVRRGMFVAGLGAAQFAMPAAVDMLRGLRSEQEKIETLFLAATDPANPYGGLLPWPRRSDEMPSESKADGKPAQNDPQESEQADASTRGENPASRSLSRSGGAGVILINGNLAAFLRRRNLEIQIFLPESEPERTRYARELAKKLAEIAIFRQGRKSGLLIGTINGEPARIHFMARFLEESGFVNTAVGFQMRRITAAAISPANESGATENVADESSDVENEEDDVETESAEPA